MVIDRLCPTDYESAAPRQQPPRQRVSNRHAPSHIRELISLGHNSSQHGIQAGPSRRTTAPVQPHRRLLQTEQYARAVLATRPNTTDEETDQLVSARMERQAILAQDDPPLLWVVRGPP